MTTDVTATRETTALPGLGPILDVRQLAKTYNNGHQAVKGLSFSVERGEVFGLLGPNGAGKSTTMSMLSGTTTPSSGNAFVRGVSIAESRTVRRRIGIAFQDSVLDTEFTGRENLRLHARLWGMAKQDANTRIDELLAFMGLTARADENVRNYSGGMRRRLELARALLAKPALVLLDEPTVGLDPAVRDEIWALIRRMRAEESISIVVSTHYLEEAEAACDRVGIMNHGNLVAIGSPARLITELGEEMIEVVVAGELSGVTLPAQVNRHATRIRHGVLTAPLANDGAAALDELLRTLRTTGHTVSRALLRKTTLADVFAAMISEDDDEPNAKGAGSDVFVGPVAA
jgi:ABC-2 type transport system ATP-binding protein